MKPILVKTVKELNGTILGVELCQGDNTVTISIVGSEHDNHKTGYRWIELKAAIDKIIEREYRLSNVLQ